MEPYYRPLAVVFALLAAASLLSGLAGGAATNAYIAGMWAGARRGPVPVEPAPDAAPGGRVWLRWAAPLLILLAAFNALMYTVGPQFPIPALPTYNASGTGYWVISTATVLASSVIGLVMGRLLTRSRHARQR